MDHTIKLAMLCWDVQLQLPVSFEYKQTSQGLARRALYMVQSLDHSQHCVLLAACFDLYITVYADCRCRVGSMCVRLVDFEFINSKDLKPHVCSYGICLAAAPALARNARQGRTAGC
jgi:hypothetical protein